MGKSSEEMILPDHQSLLWDNLVAEVQTLIYSSFWRDHCFRAENGHDGKKFCFFFSARGSHRLRWFLLSLTLFPRHSSDFGTNIDCTIGELIVSVS